MMKAYVFNIVSVLLLTGADQVGAQVDNFDDGNDEGWTHYSPLADLGVAGEFTFPGGDTYRIQAPVTPEDLLEAGAGPARAGSIREDVRYTDFYLAVDLLAWEINDQNFGLLARITESGLGPGKVNGYVLAYNPEEKMLYISLVEDEAAAALTQADLILDPDEDYRMVFEATGNDFTGRIFALSDLENPIVTISTVDKTWPSGFGGLFTAVIDTDEEPGDVTFDNFLAAEVEPSRSGIVDVRVKSDPQDPQELLLSIEFYSKPGRT